MTAAQFQSQFPSSLRMQPLISPEPHARKNTNNNVFRHYTNDFWIFSQDQESCLPPCLVSFPLSAGCLPPFRCYVSCSVHSRALTHASCFPCFHYCIQLQDRTLESPRCYVTCCKQSRIQGTCSSHQPHPSVTIVWSLSTSCNVSCTVLSSFGPCCRALSGLNGSDPDLDPDSSAP
jgi:hypothetical protein